MVDGPSQPRLLFVLSNDFGELSCAVSFVRGTSLAALLLLPDRLYCVNGGHLPEPHRRYGSADDVLRTVEQYRPDIVFLFCGYLFVINGIFDHQTFAGLVARLQESGVRVVTSDPFLGLLSHVNDSTVRCADSSRARFTGVLTGTSDLLRPLPHLYQNLAEPVGRHNSVAFFNPPPLVPLTREEGPGCNPLQPVNGEGKSWLFILGTVDYYLQLEFSSPAVFHAALLERLADAARQGCRPVLFAPRRVLMPCGKRSPPSPPPCC